MFGWRKRAQQPVESAGPRISARILPSETAARQAAAGGSPEEMNRLGNQLKVNGKQDEAAEWYRRAADAGNSDAMANLATYLMAQGRNQEAAQWFRRAGGPLGEAFAQRLSAMPDEPR
jgi:TPR repeat protein